MSAVIDSAQLLKLANDAAVMKFKSLHPQFEKTASINTIAALEAVMKQSSVKITKVDWEDLPDRDEVFVHHTLQEDQQKKLNELIAHFKSTGLLAKTVEKYGNSLLNPFDIELAEGGEEYLSGK